MDTYRVRRLFSLKLGTVGVALAGAALWGAGAHASSNAVNVEAVDHFGSSSIICIAEADNYRNHLINASGTIFTAGQRYTDSLVWDSDFIDPEASGSSLDQDATFFDHAGSFSSYFCGHGICDDDPAFNGLSAQSCTASTQCNKPPAGMAMPGYCLGNGPTQNSHGTCFYQMARKMVISSNSNNHYSNVINYSSGARIKFGESSNSGTWGGAGTNGGQNFAIISNSCGLRPSFYWEETHQLFAGIHALGIIMPITSGSDDWDAPDRGTFVAQGFSSNINSSVGLSFIDAINSMAQNEGPGCPSGSGSNYSHGGGHGIGGCGAQVIESVDGSTSATNWHTLTESWLGMTLDGNDATGGNWISAYIACNYDCNNNPIVL
jgi:hypothetical protein